MIQVINTHKSEEGRSRGNDKESETEWQMDMEVSYEVRESKRAKVCEIPDEKEGRKEKREGSEEEELDE